MTKKDGVGFSIKDGWYFGIGFGLAMTIAVPLILLSIACFVGTGLIINFSGVFF